MKHSKHSPKRFKALNAIYRRERAASIRALADSEAEAERIESLLVSTRDLAVSLRMELESRSTEGEISAGRLQMDLADRERKIKQLDDFHEREVRLIAQRREAEHQLDAARDNVAKAQKALDALSEPTN